MNLLEAIVSFT